MKYFLLILFFFVYISCSQTRNIVQDNAFEKSELYKISKIKKEKSFFVIYAQRNDSTFMIVSEKEDSNFNCNNIKVKRKYNLELKKIFPRDSLMGYAIAPNLGIVFTYGEERKIIRTEKEAHFSIYHADNLNGLCLTKDDE